MTLFGAILFLWVEHRSGSSLLLRGLRSASPHSGPSHRHLRHRFAITSCRRATPPALSGGGYASQKQLLTAKLRFCPCHFDCARPSLSSRPSVLTVISTKRSARRNLDNMLIFIRFLDFARNDSYLRTSCSARNDRVDSAA